ncbi:BlaI/MecI/CopY family transcriptional regulator [soil metagenome]
MDCDDRVGDWGVRLTRRERQIMEVVFAAGRSAGLTAREIHGGLPDAPGYSSVRKLLSILIEKGELRAERVGRALVYRPVRSPEAAARSAVRRLVDTFFGGSLEAAVAGILESGEEPLSAQEAAELRRRIAEAEGADPEGELP